MLFLLHSLNICATIPLDASVAQLVEQLIRNQQVAGSSPVTSSKQKSTAYGGVFLFEGLWWRDLKGAG